MHVSFSPEWLIVQDVNDFRARAYVLRRGGPQLRAEVSPSQCSTLLSGQNGLGDGSSGGNGGDGAVGRGGGAGGRGRVRHCLRRLTGQGRLEHGRPVEERGEVRDRIQAWKTGKCGSSSEIHSNLQSLLNTLRRVVYSEPIGLSTPTVDGQEVLVGLKVLQADAFVDPELVAGFGSAKNKTDKKNIKKKYLNIK